MRATPLLGRMRAETIRRSVDLPAPFGPSTTQRWPRSTVQSRSRRITLRPRHTLTCSRPTGSTAGEPTGTAPGIAAIMDRGGARGSKVSGGNWPESREPLWEQVPDRVGAQPEPTAPAEPARRRRWPAAAAVLAVALAAWAGWATYAMVENGHRAAAWQRESETVRRHAA